MGMSAGTSDIIQAIILGGLGFAGSAMQGSPQQHVPFTGANSPDQMMTEQHQRLTGAYNDASQRAHSPVELPSSYVQDVPTFTGGGLPMPIGVRGHDPALANPELKRIIEGQIGGWQPSQGPDPQIATGKNTSPLATPENHTDMTGDVPISTQVPGYRSGIARRPLPGMDMLNNGTDPSTSAQYGMDPAILQAHGAIDLLRHAIGA